MLQELCFLVLRLPLPPLAGLPASKTPFLSRPPESKGNPASAISYSGPRGGVGARFVQDLGTSLLVSGHCLCPSSLPHGANRPVLLTKEIGQGGAYPIPSLPAVQDNTARASISGLPSTLDGNRTDQFPGFSTLRCHSLVSEWVTRELVPVGCGRGPSPGA